LKIDLSPLPTLVNTCYYPLLKNDSRYLILYGGGGSGKSVFAVQKILFRILTEKNHKFLVVRKVASTSRDSTFALFKFIISQWGLDSLVDINKTEMTITFKGDINSVILFKGIDDSEKIKSIANITSIWIEEVTELEEQDLSQLDKRLRGKTGFYKQITMTFNPVSESHWIKDKFFDNPGESIVDKIFTLKTTYKDNRFIDEEYKQVLESSKGNDYRVYTLGEWGSLSTGAEFYSGFDYQRNTCEVEYDEDLPLILGFDFNVLPYCSLVICQLQEKELRVIQEKALPSPNNNTKALCTEFKRLYPNHSAGVIIVGDSSGLHSDTRGEWGSNDYSIIFKELEKYRPINKVPNKNPRVVTRGQFINSVFRDSYEGIEIKIDPLCKKLIDDFLYGKTAQDGTKLKQVVKDKTTGASYQKYFHMSDAFDYVVCLIFLTDFLKYSNTGSGKLHFLKRPENQNYF
jgi:phage terminase large subunit